MRSTTRSSSRACAASRCRCSATPAKWPARCVSWVPSTGSRTRSSPPCARRWHKLRACCPNGWAIRRRRRPESDAAGCRPDCRGYAACMASNDTPSLSAGQILVRDAAAADMTAIQAIYAHHVLHGLATFEEVPPSVADMTERRAAVLKAGLPYLAAEIDGTVVAYAYATA